MNKENNKISKVILNLIQDLQRLLGSFSNGVRGRCQIKFGMTSYVKGFTLIELLIAVLIIGVLVAVAVPQYQKAVLKSRFSSLMPLGKALHDGNESYYLEHGSYTNDPTKLDVRASNSNAQITLGNEKLHKYVLLTRNDMHNKLVIYQKNSEFFPNETHCEALKTDTRANWLCGEGLKGTLLTERALSDGYNTYLLQGSGDGGFPRMLNDANDQILERGDSCQPTVADSCHNIQVTDGECLARKTDYSCSDSVFINSLCEGKNNSCRDNQFENSTCETGGWQACSGTFNNGSVCNGRVNQSSGCQGTFNDSVCNAFSGWWTCRGTFNNSRCYSNIAQSLNCSGTFQNGSICYALAPTGCGYATFKDTSYCAGDYCPNNAPSGTAGKKWYRGTGEDWPDDRPSELVDK